MRPAKDAPTPHRAPAEGDPLASVPMRAYDRFVLPIMEPTNDHEREIASIVDEKARSTRSKLDNSSIPKITRTLTFFMSRTDSQFLARYIQWRIDHPISGESAVTHE